MDDGSEIDAEEFRLDLIERLERKEIDFRWFALAEVADIFQRAERMVGVLTEQFDWTLLRSSPDSPFVLSDTPITSYDSKPANALMPGGLMTSRYAQTTMPLDPTTCLMLRPGPGQKGTETVYFRFVDDINLRSYAAADNWVYGPSANCLQKLHQLASDNPVRLAEVSPKAPRHLDD